MTLRKYSEDSYCRVKGESRWRGGESGLNIAGRLNRTTRGGVGRERKRGAADQETAVAKMAALCRDQGGWGERKSLGRRGLG